MLPVLKLGAAGPMQGREAVQRLSDEFKLDTEERQTLLPSGKQTTITNRTHWAITYLVKAGLLERPQRGWFSATCKGQKLLANPPKRLDLKFLQKYEGIREFTSPNESKNANSEINAGQPSIFETPREQIDSALEQIHSALRQDIKERIAGLTPTAFEQLIVDLMRGMGYGAGGDSRRIGQSGDGGVDGIISEDQLGLDVVYLQAKRYDPVNRIGPGQIREFIGSLAIKRSAKGVFVTTSSFTDSAWAEASQAGQRLVLIDGNRLADLMIRHDVGVRVAQTVPVKEVDLNYFDEV